MRNEFFRTACRSYYDMQKLRIQNGNRITAAFRHKLGLDSSQAEEENEKASDLLNDIRKEFKRLTDGVKRVTRNIKCDSPLISSRAELSLIESYERQLETEKSQEAAIMDELLREPIWTRWLVDVRGVGPLMASVILSEIDIYKCNSISALHAYCGLDVVVSVNEYGEQVEEGRCRKKSHLKPKYYINAAGVETETVGISFNPFLKTKLIGVLGSIFIRAGGEYKEIYDGYKFRLENHPKHKDKTKAHRHNMAVRYMVKEFLADLWTEWRTIEGLEVRGTYAEDKLGIVHHKK